MEVLTQDEAMGKIEDTTERIRAGVAAHVPVLEYTYRKVFEEAEYLLEVMNDHKLFVDFEIAYKVFHESRNRKLAEA
jgi:hypothetical protein